MVCSGEFGRIVSRSLSRGWDPGEVACRRVESRAKLGAVVAGYCYGVRWSVRVPRANYESELGADSDGLRTWNHERRRAVHLHYDRDVSTGCQETVRRIELHRIDPRSLSSA